MIFESNILNFLIWISFRYLDRRGFSERNKTGFILLSNRFRHFKLERRDRILSTSFVRLFNISWINLETFEETRRIFLPVLVSRFDSRYRDSSLSSGRFRMEFPRNRGGPMRHYFQRFEKSVPLFFRGFIDAESGGGQGRRLRGELERGKNQFYPAFFLEFRAICRSSRGTSLVRHHRLLSQCKFYPRRSNNDSSLRNLP